LAQASSLSPPGAVLVATRRTADADGADRFAADLACATVSEGEQGDKAKDILGRVYE
jgi:hypothetical protein